MLRSLTLHSLRTLPFLALVACGLIVSPAFASVTILQHSFSGPAGTDLGGVTTDIGGGIWETNFGNTGTGEMIFQADGTIIDADPNAANGGPATREGGALLAFNPTAGNVYTLEATINNSSVNDAWVALGFASNNAQLVGNNGRHSNANPNVFGGYAWALTRNSTTSDNQEIFNGLGANNAVTGGNLVDASQDVTIAIELDTTDINAVTASYFLNGTAFGGVQTLDVDAFNDISFVGISRDIATGAGLASISNFSLSVQAIPEPGSLAVLGLSGIAMVIRRRRS